MDGPILRFAFSLLWVYRINNFIGMNFPTMYIISISIANIEFEYQSKICLLRNNSWQKKQSKKALNNTY